MQNDKLLKQLKNVVNAALPLDHNEGVLDEKIIDSTIETFASLDLYKSLSENQIKSLRNEIHANYKIRLDRGTALVSKQHKMWFATRKPSLDMKYWNRFEQYLQNDKGFSKNVVSGLDTVSDDVVDLLGDPKGDKHEQRRGLIIGDVQSGKTVNYSGIICKAVDAGYRTIILMTGTSNDLRRQTQIRLDEAFIGIDSASVGKKDGLEFIGAGKYDPSLSPQSITTTERDFSKAVSRSLVTRLNKVSDGTPMLFVIKKNPSVLKHLTEWIKAQNQIADNKIDNSILMIDDEADYASINTKGPNSDPTTTNRLIVDLLNNFRFASYVGFTATPYANIFIDPKSNQEMKNENLFPGDYIYTLEAPDNYIGARDIFPENSKYHKIMLREIDDGEEYYPLKHLNGDDFGGLSGTLKNAINAFMLANVIRDLRGHGDSHRSMMVNVSRFNVNQNRLSDAINMYVTELKTSISNYASLPKDKALQDDNIRQLYETYAQEYKDVFSWDDIQKNLLKSTESILVFATNQGSKKLNYDEYDGGLRAIVVGGLALSRGLTLEGLMVSYIYRSSRAYDTLMQMGRWFGYRKNYDDISRVWMDDETQGFYRSISEATDELRSEIKRMSDRKATPLEFGLKVRNDPLVPLMVTARNKMRLASLKVINSTLSGAVVETPILNNDVHINSHNLAVVRYLIRKLNITKNDKGRYGAHNVDVSLIIELLDSVDVPAGNTQFDSKAIAKFLDKYAGPELKQWDIAIISGEESDFNIIDGITIPRSRRQYRLSSDSKYIRLNQSRLGTTSDPTYGLSKEQLEIVRMDNKTNNKGKQISSKRYFSSVLKGRNPLLMLYFVDLKGEVAGTQDFKDEPLIGLAIGIPELTDEETKYISYQTNVIYQALGGDEDEYDDSEDGGYDD